MIEALSTKNFQPLGRQIAFCISLALTGTAFAISPESPSPITTAQREYRDHQFTLADLIQELLTNNSQLRSATGTATAAQFGVEPAKALDNPSLNITQDPLRNNPLAVGTSTGMSWSFSQNLSWPGKKQLSGDIAQAQADYTKEQVNQLKAQLLGQLKTAWINWQQTTAQIQVATVQANRLEQIKAIVKLRYANNAAAYVDFINAQVTQAQIQNDILGLQRQAKALLAQISWLIGYTSDQGLNLETIHISAERDLSPLSHFKHRALATNPAIKASKFFLTAAQRSVDLAELGKRPDFNVGVLSHSAAPPWGVGNSSGYGLSLSATFPLYFSSKERNLIDQAKAQLGAARDADESLEQQIRLAVETAYLQWAQSIEQLKLTEERIVTQARVGYRMALSNYSNNQMSYMDLLNSYNTLRTAELAVEQARSAALQARIALDVAVGESANQSQE